MYTTSKRIKEAKAKGEAWATDKANVARILTEQSEVRKVVKRILAKGYSVRIYDGEETTGYISAFATAWKALGETDEDRIHVYDGLTRLGSVLLIWGNGEDIVSDWSWNATVKGSEIIMDELSTGDPKWGDFFRTQQSTPQA